MHTVLLTSCLWSMFHRSIFSPSQSVVGHIYVRRHKPKFWESVHRTFTMGVHNPLQVRPLIYRIAITWTAPNKYDNLD